MLLIAVNLFSLVKFFSQEVYIVNFHQQSKPSKLSKLKTLEHLYKPT